MIYSVRHVTIFRYEPAVRESIMEVRMQPRSEGRQRCLNFQSDREPGDQRHALPRFHGQLGASLSISPVVMHEVKLTAQGVVEVESRDLPFAGAAGNWDELDAITAD